MPRSFVVNDRWEHTPASQVVVGDRIRVRSTEITVARIESQFLGRPEMIAFIEDTPERWLKVPSPKDAEVEVRRDA